MTHPGTGGSAAFPAGTAPTAHVPTYRLLAQGITDMILAGELKPGDALPTEQTLCEQFDVNRSSVREGVRLLEEAGLLRRVNPKRLVISRPSAAELGQQLGRGLLLHEVTFRELWQTAMVIEPAAASLAARRASRAHLASLAENLRATEASLSDNARLVELDLAFHELIAQAAHNRVLQLTREPMGRLFFPAFEAVLTRVPTAGGRLLKAHRAVLSALAAGDAGEAADWMSRHIRDFKRGFEVASLDIDSPALQPRSRPAAGARARNSRG
jgi:DNA-binding FadR family transcriptional regulator